MIRVGPFETDRALAEWIVPDALDGLALAGVTGRALWRPVTDAT